MNRSDESATEATKKRNNPCLHRLLAAISHLANKVRSMTVGSALSPRFTLLSGGSGTIYKPSAYIVPLPPDTDFVWAEGIRLSCKKRSLDNLCQGFCPVPVTGLEPVRSCPRGILSPLRLPIPPHRLTVVINYCSLPRFPSQSRAAKLLLREPPAMRATCSCKRRGYCFAVKSIANTS